MFIIIFNFYLLINNDVFCLIVLFIEAPTMLTPGTKSISNPFSVLTTIHYPFASSQKKLCCIKLPEEKAMQ